MAGKRVTTELVVKAVDQYSGMIRNMSGVSGVSGRFAEKVRSDMGRLQGLRGPLRRSRKRVAELRREMHATSNSTKK